MPGGYDQSTLVGFREAANERMRAIEAQLALLSEKAGVPYDAPSANVPEEVVALAAANDMLGAVKKYRELTGVTMDEARAVVDKL
jgi:ribosomal protein L7/L12